MRASVLPILAILIALCLARQPVTPEARTKCDDIGASSGCSGCNHPTTGCEWCSNSYDETARPAGFKSACAPKGYCDAFNKINGQPWESAPTLCPADPYMERKLRGSVISVNSQARFSPAFAPHYCEFPTTPWAVDRFSNIYGNNNPSLLCNLFNEQLYLGQRTDVESFCSINISNVRVQECMRRFHSLQCATACPAYGKPVRFNKICSEECASLRQVCDIPASCPLGEKRDGENVAASLNCKLSQCLTILAETKGGGVPYNCADDGDKDCDKPQLIQPTGEYEYDYCFYGDPSRCKKSDCEIRISSTWGNYYSNNCPCCESRESGYYGWTPTYDSNGDYDVEGTFRSETCSTEYPTTYPPISGAPVCIFSNRRAAPIYDDFKKRAVEQGSIPLRVLDKVGIAFDIVKPAGEGGRTCEEVIQSTITGLYDTFGDRYFTCNYDPAVRKCVGVIEVEEATECAEDVDNRCLVPTQLNCMYDDNTKVKKINAK